MVIKSYEGATLECRGVIIQGQPLNCIQKHLTQLIEAIMRIRVLKAQ